MKRGSLAVHFSGLAAKRLSAVEADGFSSNQHEFNGVGALRAIMDPATEKVRYRARFMYIADSDDEPVVDDGYLTWYDARQRHPVRSEHRLYFPSTAVSACAAEGDLLVIGRRPDDSMLVVVAAGGSTIASQIEWLFGLSTRDFPGFSVREELETLQDRVAFASRFILEQIGVVAEPPADPLLDEMLRRFGGTMPKGEFLSAFARESLPDIGASGSADDALLAWTDREEILYRTLERHLIAGRLAGGQFSPLSSEVQQRRRRRLDGSLANHLSFLLAQRGIRFCRDFLRPSGGVSDFLFPGEREHADPVWPGERLACLDLWRSGGSREIEGPGPADRVRLHHLLTLETAVSHDMTAQMQARQVRLVVPRALHTSYDGIRRGWLWDMDRFVSLVDHNQSGEGARSAAGNHGPAPG